MENKSVKRIFISIIVVSSLVFIVFFSISVAVSFINSSIVQHGGIDSVNAIHSTNNLLNLPSVLKENDVKSLTGETDYASANTTTVLIYQFVFGVLTAFCLSEMLACLLMIILSVLSLIFITKSKKFKVAKILNILICVFSFISLNIINLILAIINFIKIRKLVKG